MGTTPRIFEGNWGEADDFLNDTHARHTVDVCLTLEQSFISEEGHFLFVSLFDLDVVVAPLYVKFHI
jgi:hypothetical protein